MKFLKRILGNKKPYIYEADGFGVRNKNIDFMKDESFASAYEWSAYFEWAGRKSSWTHVDLRWRAHICVWAAAQALHLDGDFCECGVDTAIFSGVIAKYLDFAKQDRKFFLFDTYEGIPDVEGMSEHESRKREHLNAKRYSDSFEFVRNKFKDYSNVEIVRGFLPDTLVAVDGRKIAYLSVDLNNAPSEQAVIQRLWPQLVPGAFVVMDDYAFKGHQAQYDMWNAFAARHKLLIATLPTGQGLLVKPRS